MSWRDLSLWHSLSWEDRILTGDADGADTLGDLLATHLLERGYSISSTSNNSGWIDVKSSREALFAEAASGNQLLFRTLNYTEKHGYTSPYQEYHLTPTGYVRIWVNCDDPKHNDSEDKDENDDSRPTCDFEIVSIDEAALLDLDSRLRAHVSIEGPPSKGYLSVLMRRGEILSISPIKTRKIAEPFIPTNYSESVRKAFDQICQDLNRHDPLGRLVILEGPTGTGKTHLGRAIQGAVKDANFVLVKPDVLPRLEDPDVLPVLLDHANSHPGKPLVLIVEDADTILASRSSDNVSLVSSALNLTDGMLGAALDLRIIATTNKTSDEIDEALTRKGRISCFCHVGPLNPQEADQCFKALTGSVPSPSFEQSISLADVYAMVKGITDQSTPKRRQVGFVS